MGGITLKWEMLISILHERGHFVNHHILMRSCYLRTNRGLVLRFEDYGWGIFVSRCYEDRQGLVDYVPVRNPGRFIKRYYETFKMEELL